MKLHIQTASVIILALFAIPLVSCVETGYPAHRSYSSTGTRGVYSSIPGGYAGYSYYYNGRYYTGGRHETGRFNHQGRSYNDRYYHNGQYFYGGTYRQHQGSGSPQHQGDNHENRDNTHEGYSLRESNRSPQQSSYRSPGGYKR